MCASLLVATLDPGGNSGLSLTVYASVDGVTSCLFHCEGLSSVKHPLNLIRQQRRNPHLNLVTKTDFIRAQQLKNIQKSLIKVGRGRSGTVFY